MTATPDDAVLAALRRLLPDRGAAIFASARHTPLDGGVNRRSFLVELGTERWVLRLPTPGAAGLIDLATEAAAMRAAAAKGLAPAVVGVDAANGTLLTAYRAGAVSWTEADARKPRNVERAARLLRALHVVEAPVPAYAAERISRGYLAALEASAAPQLTRFGGRIAAWSEELLELARAFDALHPPTAFCHNDLAAANFIDEPGGTPDGRAQDGRNLLLVDFEYAVRSSPLLDLAGLAGMNGFTPAQRRDLLDVYGEGAPAVAELDRAVRMLRLMSFFWALLGAQRTDDAAPYSRLAVELGELLE